MITEMNGNAQLVSLYGEDIGNEINRAAQIFGVSPQAIAEEIANNPSLLGTAASDMVGAIGSTVGSIFPTIIDQVQKYKQAQSGGAVIPAAPAAVQNSAGINTPFGVIDPKMLLLPAVAVAIFFVARNMKKSSRKRR
jgi:hypothetical protein